MGVFESVTHHRLSDAKTLLVGGGRDVGGGVSVVEVGQLRSVAVDSCARRGECKVVSGETCEGRGSSKARPGTRAQPGGMLTRLEIAGASRSRAVKGGRPSIFAMEKNQMGEVETRHGRVTKILI